MAGSYLPLEETLDAFQALKRRGLILDYGVSNFDVTDMFDAFSLPGGSQIVTDQVLYNLKHRGIEWDLLPWCRDHNLPIMAYSPIEHSPHEQRGMLDQPAIVEVAARLGSDAGADRSGVAAAAGRRGGHSQGEPPGARSGEPRCRGYQIKRRGLEKLDAAFPRPESKVPLEVR